ncbi:DUF6123 family protein [Heyndrickxia sp. NPDC080065]|uniref:DUF6123 family protein n=1 Tax=Heyndrickxia sp. NPDC080065 TaxID=3390568 RepID=UPI003D057B86
MKEGNNSLDDYIIFLREKGFKFEEDVIGFIYFGKQYTKASDQSIKAAIEITLKTQKHFDGSFYMSLLETFKKQNIETRKQAYSYVQELGLLPA